MAAASTPSSSSSTTTITTTHPDPPSIHLLNPLLKPSHFRSLPPEILLRILSYLTPHELAQTAAVCREWYHLSSDPSLWRHLDLSNLKPAHFHTSTASTLRRRLAAAHTFTLTSPTLPPAATTALLTALAASPRLHTLTLTSLSTPAHTLLTHFRLSRAVRLTHVDLSGTPVTTAAVVELLQKHGSTLQTLKLADTRIGDGSLKCIAAATQLHTLDVSGCSAISATSLRNFLTKRFPPCIRTLRLQRLPELKPRWVLALLKLPAAAGLARLELQGCQRLTCGDVAAFRELCGGRVRIESDAQEVPADSVWGYRRYIEELVSEPRGSLVERLGPGCSGEPAETERARAPECPEPPQLEACKPAEWEPTPARERIPRGAVPLVRRFPPRVPPPGMRPDVLRI